MKTIGNIIWLLLIGLWSALGFVFAGIVKAILRAISASYFARDNKLKGQVDSKLKSKIAQKKQAQGLRPENNGGEHSWEQNM